MLNRVVPIERASMPGRAVIQWDKEDCADMGLIKVRRPLANASVSWLSSGRLIPDMNDFAVFASFDDDTMISIELSLLLRFGIFYDRTVDGELQPVKEYLKRVLEIKIMLAICNSRKDETRGYRSPPLPGPCTQCRPALKNQFQHRHGRFEDENQTCFSSRCELFSAPSIVSGPRTTPAQIFCVD